MLRNVDSVFRDRLFRELRQIRKRIAPPVDGLSPAELARRMDVSPQLVRNWMRLGIVLYGELGKAKRISTVEAERLLAPVEKSRAKLRVVNGRGPRRKP